MATERDRFAAVIRTMPYGELKQIAKELARMAEDHDARPTMESTEDYADLLWDWAEAQATENA